MPLSCELGNLKVSMGNGAGMGWSRCAVKARWGGVEKKCGCRVLIGWCRLSMDTGRARGDGWCRSSLAEPAKWVCSRVIMCVRTNSVCGQHSLGVRS